MDNTERKLPRRKHIFWAPSVAVPRRAQVLSPGLLWSKLYPMLISSQVARLTSLRIHGKKRKTNKKLETSKYFNSILYIFSRWSVYHRLSCCFSLDIEILETKWGDVGATWSRAWPPSAPGKDGGSLTLALMQPRPRPKRSEEIMEDRLMMMMMIIVMMMMMMMMMMGDAEAFQHWSQLE